MCTLLNGVPDGPAHIILKDQVPYCSLDGVGIFKNGVLSDGPFICINGLGYGLKFMRMADGRPAQNEFCTYFTKNHTMNIDEKQEMEDFSGCQYFSGRVRDALQHGEGRQWMSNARMFIGTFQNDRMHEGTLYEIHSPLKYNAYQVKYDIEKDSAEKIFPDYQKPIVK